MRWSAVRSSCTWTTPSSNHSAGDQADGPEDPSHRRVPRHRRGDEPAEPGGPGDHRQVLQQHRADALVLVEVGDGERHLGLLAAGHGVVLADADQLVAGLGDEGDVSANVLHRRGRQLLGRG